MYIDATAPTFDWRGSYKFFLGCVNPRPIALVSTRAPDGRLNLAPFSFFNMVSASPPVLMFSCALNRHRERKHTHINIDQTREFVVAIVSEAIAPQMVRCGAELPYGESEFEFSGLTPAPATQVGAPLVKEAPANIECRLRQVISMGDQPGAGQVIFGDIVALHINDVVLKDTRDAVDPHRMRTVGRLGEAYYSTVTEPYALHIPGASGG